MSHDILDEMPEMAEAADRVGGLPQDASAPGVLAMNIGYPNGNHCSATLGSKVKTDKVLGLDPNAKLASFYLVSGLPRVRRGSYAVRSTTADETGLSRLVAC
jgi:hypothetical protein